jgi:peptidoglycan/LPS O-acetylase OafA/YrhL
MLAGLLAKRLKSRTGYYYTTLMAEFCMVALVVNFILCALLVQSAPISNAIPLATGKYMFYAEYLLSPVLFMWILALTNPDSSGVTKWLLSSWPCRQLGKVSYSMYCLHFPLLNWIAWAAAGKGLTADSVPIQQNFGWYYFELWAAVPVLLIVLALSSLAYWLVESRARRALTPASANTVIQQYISS